MPAASPKKILIDFESAALGAFSAGYPEASVTGCYFHLNQSVLRKVNELGMKTDYENDDALRGSVRCLSALAHVPVGNVNEAFDLLAESMPEHDKMNELLSYFEHTYIRGRRLRGRYSNYGAATFQSHSGTNTNLLATVSHVLQTSSRDGIMESSLSSCVIIPHCGC